MREFVIGAVDTAHKVVSRNFGGHDPTDGGLRPAGAGDPDRAGVRDVRLVLEAWFGAIASSIDLAYAKADRGLLRFRG